MTKQSIDSEKLYHRKVINSKIPNRHFEGDIQGLQVGNYFWILGDVIHSNYEDDWIPQDSLNALNGN